MTEERLDLDALRPDPQVRDRVVADTMARIRAEEAGLGRSVLFGAARLVRPVLAAAAIVLLFLLLPGREPHPDTRAAQTLLAASTDVPATWLNWSLGRQTPDPGEVLVLYSESTP